MAARQPASAHKQPSGTVRAVAISADGARVLFLRPAGPADTVDQLWLFEVGTGQGRVIFDPSPSRIEAYTVDSAGRLAAVSTGDRLVRLDLRTGAAREYETPAPPRDPQPSPDGRHLAYLAGRALRVVDLDTGADHLLAGEADDPQVSWGSPEYVAERLGRSRGYWWAPDGASVLAARVDTGQVAHRQVPDLADLYAAPASLADPPAGGTNARVTLHLLQLDGGWVDVHWDRETYPYLARVSWTERGAPLIAVLRRLQQHGLVLAIDQRTGETQVHAELTDPRWVNPVPGTPCHLADGRVLIGGELAHDGYDARCLFADGSLLTPPSLYVRRVCGSLGRDIVVEASDREPSEQHLYRVETSLLAGVTEAHRITTAPGWHTGVAGGDTLVVGARSLDHPGVRWSVYAGGVEVGRLAGPGAPSRSPAVAPRPILERVTDRRIPAGVLYPGRHVTGRRLPVLVEVAGGPDRQGVVATRGDWQERQWWAEAGFAVVVVDQRGTPGLAPSYEKAVHRRLADVSLADQVDALAALGEKHTDLDLTRVAIRGNGFGGWLATMAVLFRPEAFHCAVAIAPVVDWSLESTAYVERLLGLPDEGGEVYAHNSALEAAAEPPAHPEDARPLLLVPQLDTRSNSLSHTVRLSTALLAAGRPHTVIPRPSGTDPTTAAELRRLELDFVRRSLG